MARERVEDLGRIYERTKTLIRDNPLFRSRREEEFIKAYVTEEALEALYWQIEALTDEVVEISEIAAGEDHLNEEV